MMESNEKLVPYFKELSKTIEGTYVLYKGLNDKFEPDSEWDYPTIEKILPTGILVIWEDSGFLQVRFYPDYIEENVMIMERGIFGNLEKDTEDIKNFIIPYYEDRNNLPEDDLSNLTNVETAKMNNFATFSNSDNTPHI